MRVKELPSLEEQLSWSDEKRQAVKSKNMGEHAYRAACALQNNRIEGAKARLILQLFVKRYKATRPGLLARAWKWISKCRGRHSWSVNAWSTLPGSANGGLYTCVYCSAVRDSLHTSPEAKIEVKYTWTKPVTRAA